MPEEVSSDLCLSRSLSLSFSMLLSRPLRSLPSPSNPTSHFQLPTSHFPTHCPPLERFDSDSVNEKNLLIQCDSNGLVWLMKSQFMRWVRRPLDLDLDLDLPATASASISACGLLFPSCFCYFVFVFVFCFVCRFVFLFIVLVAQSVQVVRVVVLIFSILSSVSLYLVFPHPA